MKSPSISLGSRYNFLGLETEFSAFDSSKVVILPAPFEITKHSGASTKNGPQSIIQASRTVKWFDEETKREVCKEFGVATLSPLNFTKVRNEAALQIIHESIVHLIGLNKFVVTLGGEHTITSGVIAAFAKKISSLSVLQFDAHCGLQDQRSIDTYGNESVMTRVCEFLDPTKLVQVGIRAQSKDEAEYVRDRQVNTFYAHEIRGGAHTRFFKEWDDAVIEPLSESVYVTFDVDAFDPSIMPATRTPEPNGLFWNEVTRCLKKVGQKRKVVGFDVVGLAPIKGLDHPNHTAARLVYKILNYSL
jgi:agmatinase